MLIEHFETNLSDILIKIHAFSFKKMHLKNTAILSRSQCFKALMPTQFGRRYTDILNFTEYFSQASNW